MEPAACLVRQLRHPCVRILLRVLPITAFATFTLTLLLSKSFYEAAGGRQEYRLDTISTYGAGNDLGANIIVFRIGVALTVSQVLVCETFRAALMIRARAPKPSDGSNRIRCVLVALTWAVVCATIGCLGGATIVTIAINAPVHYNLAAGAFGGLLLIHALNLLTFSRYILVPRALARTARLSACWGALCITSSTACLLIHQLAFYHPPLQWAGALLAFAFYLGDVFSSVLLAASAAPDYRAAGDLEAARTSAVPERVEVSDSSTTESWSLVCPGLWRCASAGDEAIV